MTVIQDRYPTKISDWPTDPRAIAHEVANDLSQTEQDRDRIAGIPDDEVPLLKESGLLPLMVPKAHGGAGASWPEAMDIVKILAKADSSTAQLYGYHLLLSVVPHLIGTTEQATHYYRETAQHNIFWANAINTRDRRLKLEPDGNGFRAIGIKTFCTGAVVADRLICAAAQPGNPLPAMVVVPGNRAGLTYNHDWDVLGQRRTASGSFTFENVRVEPAEILGPPPNLESAFPTVLGVGGLLVLSAIFTGIAEGALETTLAYTQTKARPWETATVEKATDDPYALRRYGELWAQLQGAISLTQQATAQFQWAWDKEQALTYAERGEVAIAAAAAKTLSIQVGLAITNQMFDLMGARSVANRYGYDHYWRNLRTLTLHDPLDYKLFDIGNWVVNGTAPVPSSYA
ncbi:Dibenzothiophene desulfurization enzyme C [Halomicronema hongdechloris C2206]|uniref:Dibenzothiophene desulfurization enzyme C n=1 Tax=Halomicronema hongdechloris C2206 TaxID=1641165 RepID=A0A1Z3HMC3_9CYAN|nr:acyl-CoA dehydrogenase family protein [Halomicronema hongdechloris]ASC71406.1 Dibenzothiophene desulfurization enzyme C [Halomicronema hongdechloris C2206]